ncbi:uncharacterized protein JCM6883_003851 [Sporobolomyces salmoneus]|uniref:uncharacterized protein n=1 Tax=Sporobolomyces salmoneus TaxID=183962 RepID=UPI00317051D6
MSTSNASQSSSETPSNDLSPPPSSQVSRPLPDSPSRLGWAPAPKPTTWATSSGNRQGLQSHNFGLPQLGSPASQAPGRIGDERDTSGGQDEKGSNGIGTGGGGKRVSALGSRNHRTNSPGGAEPGKDDEEEEEDEEEEDGEIMMAPPVPSQNRRPPPQTQKETTTTPRRPPIVRSAAGKGQLDLQEMRLGGGRGSPLHRSSPAPRSNAPVHSNPTSARQNPPIRLVTSSMTTPAHSASSNQQSQPQSAQTSSSNNPNKKKRALSNDSQGSSAPPPQPRTNSSSSTSKKRPSVSGEGGGEAKRSKISSETKQCEKDAGAIYGAVSDMIARLKIQDVEIHDLQVSLEQKSLELGSISEEKRQFKKEISDRTRQALAKIEAANESVVTTYSEAIKASQLREEEIASSNVVDELRQDLESLKNDLSRSVVGSNGKFKLEKNEETKLEILRELQNELTNRDNVISLLRQELEKRTGELSEARDLVSTVSTERSDAYQRLDLLYRQIESDRAIAQEDRTRLRNQLDDALIAGAEKEKELKKQHEETLVSWSNGMKASQIKEDELKAEVEKIRKEMESEEAKIKQDWKEKVNKIQQESNEKLRVLSNNHAEERLKLELNLKVAREGADQIPSLKNDVKRLEQELKRSQNSVQGLVESAERDQEALRASRKEAESLNQKLATKTADVNKLEAQLTDMQSRLSISESTAAESHKVEIERLEAEKAAIFSAKTLVEAQLHELVAERDSLISTITRLESSLSSARTTTDSLEAKVDSLTQELASSETVRSEQNARLVELESDREEVEKLRKVEEELQSVRARVEEEKRAFADQEKEKLRIGLEELHAIDKMELTNKNKSLNNKLKEKEKQLNKSQNELAMVKGKLVLNPNSSATGSPESTATSGNRELAASGSRGEGAGTEEGDEKRQSSPVEDVFAPRSLTALEQAASLADETNLHERSGHSPPRISPVVPIPATSDKAKKGDDVDESFSDDNVLLPPSVTSSRLRKRSIENPDDSDHHNDQRTVATNSKPSKRPKRTVSNENKGPNRQEEQAAGESKSKVRGSGQQNKYFATTKRKK